MPIFKVEYSKPTWYSAYVEAPSHDALEALLGKPDNWAKIEEDASWGDGWEDEYDYSDISEVDDSWSSVVHLHVSEDGEHLVTREEIEKAERAEFERQGLHLTPDMFTGKTR